MPIRKDGEAAPTNKTVTEDKAGEGASGKKAENPRDALIEGFAAKIAARHVAEQLEAEENGQAPLVDADDADPAEVTPPADPATTDDPAAGDAENPPDKDVSAAVDKLTPRQFALRVVIRDGKELVRVKVNGEERFIDAETALAAIGKHESADARLRHVAQVQKELNAREQRVQAREADIATREQQVKSSLSLADAGDPDLRARAKAVANKLLTGTEDEVAAELEKVLVPRQAPAPTVDKATLRQTVKEVRAEEATVEVLTKFETDFPDIKTDKKLYALADAISDEVSTEHPDWGMAAILAETGKRTMGLHEKMTGTAPAPTPTPTPPVDRQERKRTLRPMPPARSGTQSREQPAPVETPAAIIAGIKKARGQGQ